MNNLDLRGKLILNTRKLKFLTSGLPTIIGIMIAHIMAYVLIFSDPLYRYSFREFQVLFILGSLIFIIIIIFETGCGKDVYENGIQRVSNWKDREFVTWEAVQLIEINRKHHCRETNYPFYIRFTTQEGQTYTFSYRSRVTLNLFWDPILQDNPYLNSMIENRLSAWEC